MNIVDALNIFYREDVISDFLKRCFEDSPEFLKSFLKMADINVQSGTEFHIINRLGLGKGMGTPDMVIFGNNDEIPKVIIIENKLGTGEGIDQTLRYESESSKERLLNKLRFDDAEFHFIFLTLDTTVVPGSTNFKHVHYRCFLEHDFVLNDSVLQYVFNDFKEKLQNFYTPLSEPSIALSSGQQLDSIQKKICWQKILKGKFKDCPRFNIDWGEVGGAGRNNFLFLISKPDWRAAEPYSETGLAYTFYIHIDTYINLLSGNNEVIKEIGIRFETNPYVPHVKIKDDPGYAQFIQNKNNFAERFFKNLQSVLPETKKRNSKLLIATVPVDQSGIENSVEDYKNKILLLENIIDISLEESISLYMNPEHAEGDGIYHGET